MEISAVINSVAMCLLCTICNLAVPCYSKYYLPRTKVLHTMQGIRTNFIRILAWNSIHNIYVRECVVEISTVINSIVNVSEYFVTVRTQNQRII